LPQRITTYNEIIASFPSTKGPKTALTEEELEEWWNKHRGTFHAIRWHRIILDGEYAAPETFRWEKPLTAI
jgi:hypothetical protein